MEKQKVKNAMVDAAATITEVGLGTLMMCQIAQVVMETAERRGHSALRATLEHCGAQLLALPGIAISVAVVGSGIRRLKK